MDYEINIAFSGIHWACVKLGHTYNDEAAKMKFNDFILRFPPASGWTLTLLRVAVAKPVQLIKSGE